MDETEKHYKEVIETVQKLFSDKGYSVGTKEGYDAFMRIRDPKYWTICFPGEFGQNVTETWSEEQILKSYYAHWTHKMVQANKHDQVGEQACIDDWVVVHWASRTDEFGRMTFGDCDCGCNVPVAETPEDMLKFLAGRLEYAGCSDPVARTYARDIRYVIEKFYGDKL